MTRDYSGFLSKLPPLFPPVWACEWGEDAHGVFAVVDLNGESLEMRWIPPGTFMMGSPDMEEGRVDWEGPVHEVTLAQGFWMGQTPMTQEQWKAVTGDNPSHFNDDDSLPVDSVNWQDCQECCDEINQMIPGFNASLPTEAQWEYACRAGSTTAFNNGKDCTRPIGQDLALNEVGWYDENGGNKSHPVREKKPNAWGLYDMHGNVLEWCLDDMRDYKDSDEINPVGSTDKGANRVLRGGSWYYFARNCRSAYRFQNAPGFRYFNFGFRLVTGHSPEAVK